MGGVDLEDVLIQIYRKEVKTTRWYIKIFWHLVIYRQSEFLDFVSSTSESTWSFKKEASHPSKFFKTNC